MEPLAGLRKSLTSEAELTSQLTQSVFNLLVDVYIELQSHLIGNFDIMLCILSTIRCPQFTAGT